MSYGWATVFTLAAWFAGLVIDVNVRVGDLGLRTVLSKEPNPEAFERIRNILLATSYTKKVG